MGVLAKRLAEYLEHGGGSGTGGTLRVVVGLAQAPVGSISRVPLTPQARGEALELLRASGLRGDVLLSESLRLRRVVAGVPAVTLEVAADEVEQLANSPGVEYVRPIRLHRMHLDASCSHLGVNARVRSRWTGKGVRVAVIDSGIDHGHPDLVGRVNLALSRNFTAEGTPDDVTDRNGHGTHVAAIIGGAGEVYCGVAPAVEFLICKVFDAQGHATEEGAVIEAVRWAVQNGADVINYSGGFTPPLLNGTFLVPPPWVWSLDLLEEEQEFRRAVEAGVVCVVSAGNEGGAGRRATVTAPAICPDVLAVGAVSQTLALSGFSSVGPVLRSATVPLWEAVDTERPELEPYTIVPKVDLVAPGGELDGEAAAAGGCYYLPGIVSARPSHFLADDPCGVEERYTRMSGTSQAAPHVAGLAALVIEATRAGGISWKPGEKAHRVQELLRAGSRPLSGQHGDTHGVGLPDWERIETALSMLREAAPEGAP